MGVWAELAACALPLSSYEAASSASLFSISSGLLIPFFLELGKVFLNRLYAL